ncbi:hypothetical protein SDC9_195721 [bioreactor metagenome]|uniref:Uncharacterized protein n=1 Tax=bioreactor metagenome TaxID=1076179 RepID=A0A645I9W1_9ZZZZ
MCHRKQQGEVTTDSFLFYNFGRLNAFPGRSKLDQHPFTRDAYRLVKGNYFAGFAHGALGIEGQTGIHLGGNTSGNNFEYLKSEVNRQFVHGFA